jgi:flagellar hook-associated protein 3 FlgL
MTVIANSTAAFYERATMDLSALRKQAEGLQAQLGSGSRLSRSSDNPVAASRLRGLARSEQFSAVDATNANRASADLKLADTALSTFADYVTRVRELSVQAANATLTASQRSSIGDELLQIHGSLVALANTRDSTGHALFGGEAAGPAYVLDAAGNASYAGTASAGELPLGDGQSVKRGLTGPEFLSFTSAGGPTDLMALVKGLAEALQGAVADPAQAARDALAPISDALDALTTGQTQVGARLAWIDLTSERRTTLAELNSSEEAEIGATDIAATVAELQQIMLVLEASQASFVKLANLSLFDLLR